MAEKFISRGFKGRVRETARALKERIPPGQYETKDFPVLSAGPTPRTSLERWDFSIYGEMAEVLKWTRDEFRKLPRETVTVDVHCVTKWSKLDTVWTGVSVDTLLEDINLDAQPAVGYLIAFATAVTTNLPLPTSAAEKRGLLTNTTDVRSRPSMVARAPVVPHPLFWKSEMGARLNSSGRTVRDSGSRSAIPTTDPGKSSDTRVIKRQWRSSLNGNS